MGHGVTTPALDVDIPLVELEVVDTVRDRLAGASLSLKSWTRTSSGLPFRCHSRPPFLKSPTSSFFLQSTEITGQPAATAAFAAWLMCWNWASRSGWEAPPWFLTFGLQRVAKQPHQHRHRREVRLRGPSRAARTSDLTHTLGSPPQKRLRDHPGCPRQSAARWHPGSPGRSPTTACDPHPHRRTPPHAQDAHPDSSWSDALTDRRHRYTLSPAQSLRLPPKARGTRGLTRRPQPRR